METDPTNSTNKQSEWLDARRLGSMQIKANDLINILTLKTPLEPAVVTEYFNRHVATIVRSFREDAIVDDSVQPDYEAKLLAHMIAIAEHRDTDLLERVRSYIDIEQQNIILHIDDIDAARAWVTRQPVEDIDTVVLSKPERAPNQAYIKHMIASQYEVAAVPGHESRMKKFGSSVRRLVAVTTGSLWFHPQLQEQQAAADK